MEQYIDQFGNLQFTQGNQSNGILDLYNQNQIDLNDQINMDPRNIEPPMTMDQMMYGSVLPNNIASPRTVLNQQTEFMKQPLDMNRFRGVSDMSLIDETTNDEQVDYIPGQPKSFRDSATLQEYFQNRNPLKSIGGLLGLITGNPILGLISGGAKGLGALNNKMQNSMFGKSENLAEYFNNRKIAKATGSKDFMNRPRSERNYTGPSGGDNTGGDTGAKGAADSFSNKSGMGRTDY